MALFRNAATVLTTSVVAIPLALASGLILARYLSVADRGSFGLAWNLASMVFIVVQLGLPIAVIYERRRLGSPPARLMTTHLAANLATALVGALACALIPDAIRERFLPGLDRATLVLAGGLVVTQLLSEYLRSVARALDRFDLQNWSSLLPSIGLVAALGLALVWGGGGLRAALVATLAVQLATVVGLIVILLRQTGLEPRVVPGDIVRSLRYAVPAYGQSVLLYLQERLEIFLVAYLLADPAAVGLYAVALSAANPFRMLPTALSMSVFPDLAERDPASAAQTAATLTRHSLLLTLLLSAVAMPLMPWLVPALFGAPYQAAVPAVLWLLPGVCFLAASRLLARYFQAVDQQRVLVTSRLAAVLALASLGWLWIPAFGVTGAACASTAAGLVELALVTVAFVRATRVGAGDIFLPRRSDLDPYRGRAQRLARRLRAQAQIR